MVTARHRSNAASMMENAYRTSARIPEVILKKGFVFMVNRLTTA